MIGKRRVACCGLLLVLGGCSSTGVGNPAPVSSLSLAIVNDTEGDYPVGAGGTSSNDERTRNAGGAAGDSTGAAGAIDSADSAAGSGDSAAGAAGADTSDYVEPILPQRAIQDAIVVLGELRFLPCDNDLGTPLTVRGPFIVDLKEKTTTPEIPTIQGTPGGYCGIDAPLTPALAPAALAGRSVFFDGYRTDGTFFIVYANMIATLRMRAKPGASWLGAASPPLFFWALRPRRWLAPTELDAADPVPYDNHLRAIVIDTNHHAALFFKIRMRLAGLSTLYADVDGDGTFDDPDRAAVVGEGLDDAN